MPGGFTANALALGAGGSPALAVARAENNTKTCAAITAFTVLRASAEILFLRCHLRFTI